MRKYRKQEHIENFLKTSHKNSNLFEDIVLTHRAASALNWDDLDTSTTFLGREISFPYMINAVTGGTDFADELNRDLAIIAKEMNIPMAVGSQKIAIDDPETEGSFVAVREENPDGFIIGNLSALNTLDEVKIAIDMIDADAFQLHLNIGQELVMEEGDRDFSNLYNNIADIVKHSPVPIIVKEVGMGISGEVAQDLYDLGVRNIDIAGKGGSNFMEIEALRAPAGSYNELLGWGIPTAQALIEITNLGLEDLTVISSGGIAEANHIAKSIIVGADMTAGSGEIINYLLRGDRDRTLEYLKSIQNNLKIIMMLQGAKSLQELKDVDYKVIGELLSLTK